MIEKFVILFQTLRSDENLSDKVLSDSENPPSLASTDRQGYLHIQYHFI